MSKRWAFRDCEELSAVDYKVLRFHCHTKLLKPIVVGCFFPYRLVSQFLSCNLCSSILEDLYFVRSWSGAFKRSQLFYLILETVRGQITQILFKDQFDTSHEELIVRYDAWTKSWLWTNRNYLGIEYIFSILNLLYCWIQAHFSISRVAGSSKI